MLAARVNTEDFAPITHRVFTIVSDGDLMEGVASEAASIAGHLRLGNIVSIYDDNHITIEGKTDLAFSEDVGRRFEAYGWHVQRIDGHDRAAAAEALAEAVAETGRPSLIVARTHIAAGAPTKHDSAEAHGNPLGPEEATATKRALGWPEEPKFLVPDEVRERFAARAAELRPIYDAWQRGFEGWRGIPIWPLSGTSCGRAGCCRRTWPARCSNPRRVRRQRRGRIPERSSRSSPRSFRLSPEERATSPLPPAR